MKVLPGGRQEKIQIPKLRRCLDPPSLQCWTLNSQNLLAIDSFVALEVRQHPQNPHVQYVGGSEQLNNMFRRRLFSIIKIKYSLEAVYYCSYTIKKAFRDSRPQPGSHLPNSPWAGIMTSYINYSCPGRREFQKAFFTV